MTRFKVGDKVLSHYAEDSEYGVPEIWQGTGVVTGAYADGMVSVRMDRSGEVGCFSNSEMELIVTGTVLKFAVGDEIRAGHMESTIAEIKYSLVFADGSHGSHEVGYVDSVATLIDREEEAKAERLAKRAKLVEQHDAILAEIDALDSSF